MDDAQLRALAQAFYDRAWTEHRCLPSARDDRDFWTRHYLEFARAVDGAARDADARYVALREITDLVNRHQELPPDDQKRNLENVLRAILTATRATRQS